MMDSREIYNRTRKKIDWEENWIHIGTGNKINLHLLEAEISELFEGKSKVQLKRGRRNSQTLQKNEMLNAITKLIGKEDFEIWDESFVRAMKFNKIGVINKSKYAM